MVDLNDAVNVLRAKRQELLDQLDAIEKALVALSGAGIAVTTTTRERSLPEAATEAPIGVVPTSEVVPTRLKPQRVLSDEHKHALNEGRRKARHSKDAAKGLARELLDPLPRPAAETTDVGRLPRLVKQTGR